ncbi:inositol polyphosphate 5-phosphatase K-like isoform X2 [Sipha flava]|uniref:Inositol polyphosphate 5-phosphatase K-like isoform X2 n=1 Tax=Sipha flava TaxID=143950 RepID=A0A8B8FE79_9HEMI|nr:inositol polyphosphate 5-phosphatase K-like isoform X2 [Sipha flava]
MDDLTFYIVTYNVATKSPDQPLSDFLQWDGRTKQQLPDFCLFGFQEIKAQPQNLLLDSVFDDPWTAALRDVLSNYDYVKIRTVKMVGLLLNVFCKRKHIPLLKEMEISETPTGLLGLWGNKGAVSFSFKIADITICCVNCHFAAHEEYLKRRISDYHTIIESQYFGSSRKSILNHERRPAWTDRILYKTIDSSHEKSELEVLSYNYINTIKLSDHRPVYGESSIQINSNKNVDLVEQPVIFQSIEAWQLETENEVNLRIKDYNPGVNDWIGVFNENFTSLEDYLSYVYLPSETVELEESNDGYRQFDNMTSACRVKFLPEVFSDGSKSVCLKFSETSILNSGTYRLIYFSTTNNSVLGVSNPFVAIKQKCSLNTSYEFGW